MATIRAIAVAATNPGIPRESISITYDGTSNKTVAVLLVCPTWDTASPAIGVKVQVQQSFDGRESWEDFAVLDTTVRRRTRTGAMPSMTCQCRDSRGDRDVRIVLSVDTSTLAIGVDLTNN